MFLSIAVTTKELLEKEVFFDFFYILKVLYPEKKFEEIKELSYQEEVAANLLKVEELFSEKQICSTIEKLTYAITCVYQNVLKFMFKQFVFN